MTTIHLSTKIKTSKQVIFDLSRNIDVHKLSTAKSNESAIDGITSGLINKGETVTWRGKYFGIYLTHKSIIPTMEIPSYFVDEMVEGKFKSFKHEHSFIEGNGFVMMIDKIQYQTPFGIFGKLFDILILKRHLTNFISERNKVLKELAENHQK